MEEQHSQNYFSLMEAFFSGPENASEELNSRLLKRADLLVIKGYDQYHTSQFEAALQSWQTSLKIYRELAIPQAEGVCLTNMGLACEGRGDYRQAIDYHQQALTIARAIGDRKGEGEILVNLGSLYCDLGQYERALTYYQQSLEIGEELQQELLLASALGNLGNIYQIVGDYEQAKKHLEKSLELAKHGKNILEQSYVLGNLGWLNYSLGEYDKAIEQYQQSLAIKQQHGDLRGEVHTLGRLGLVYDERGNHNQAIDYHQQGLAISREIGYRLGEIDTLKNIGTAFLRHGNLEQAEKSLDDAIDIGESLRSELGEDDGGKVSVFETQDLTYRVLQKVSIDQNKIEKALEISERSRSRIFAEYLAKKFGKENKSEGKINPPTIEQIKQIARKQSATLVEYSVIYDEFRIEGKLQAKESELFIWVVQPQGEVIFRQVDLKPLWQKEKTTLADFVAIARESLGARGRDAVRVGQTTSKGTETRRLQQLQEKLIEPIAHCLPKNDQEKVIFIPHESLLMVPFPALLDGSGKYLIEKYPILIEPSIQILDLTNRQKQQVQGIAPNQALVVGNPKMPEISLGIGQPTQKLKPLSGAQQEAMEIAELLKTKAIVGARATKAEVVPKMFSAKIIHLATHGLLDNFQDMEVPGAIALAPSKEDKGWLTAEELLRLDLNAELVVLSACDTGRGKITGDGVMGLSRSLMAAGVQSLVVSLWAIPDAPTAYLMKEFYQGWQRDGDKAQALRKAMLATMGKAPHPRNWAAFTLIGKAI